VVTEKTARPLGGTGTSTRLQPRLPAVGGQRAAVLRNL
jgi:hypothetical protein